MRKKRDEKPLCRGPRCNTRHDPWMHFCTWHFYKIPDDLRDSMVAAWKKRNMAEYARLKYQAITLLGEMFSEKKQGEQTENARLAAGADYQTAKVAE